MFDPKHIDEVLQGWAVAVPLIASAISGLMQSRANKKAARPLSDEGIQDSSNKYFPGLFSAKGSWNPNAMVNPIQTRAGGGPVAPGQPYLVGEKGPEIIQPTAPGTVIPNGGAPPAAGGAVPGAVNAAMQSMSSAPGSPQAMSNTPPPPMTAASPTTQSTTPADPNAPALPGNMQQPGATPTVGGAMPPAAGTAPAPGTPKAEAGAPAPAPGTAGGIVGTPTSQAAGGQTAGSLAVQHMLNYLSNPGEISPVGYERKQEQANQGYNLAMRSIGGGLSSAGINPNSGYGLMMGQSAALNTMKLRNEANRDFTMASEQLKREDVKTATDNYLKFLETLFGLGSKRASIMLGLDLQGPARAVGMAGQTLGTYFSDKNKGKTGSPGASPGNNIGPDDNPPS